MRTLTTRVLFILLGGLVILRAPAYAAPRTALVIGNGVYQSAPLKNPVNDAKDMGAVLRTLGFAVTLKINAGQKEMEDAIRTFGRGLREGGTGIFFFAGHGIQVRGRNYLIPVDTDIQSEVEIPYEAVDVGRLLDFMEDAGNGVNIVILDACRDNPFSRSFRSSRRGLARAEGPTGSFIAYATAPGAVAADGQGRNSPYTKHLLRHIGTPGLTIHQVFQKVRNGVRQETGNAQTPWELSSLVGADFYFAGGLTPPPQGNGGPGPGAQPTPSGADQQALLVWQGIKDSTDPSDFEDFLSDYGNSPFAGFARKRLERLRHSGLNKLLAGCRAHLRANRLTTGAGGNALACYQAVLAKDPGNEAALGGTSEMASKYVVWTRSAIARGDKAKARQNVLRLTQVDPEHPQLQTLKGKVDALSADPAGREWGWLGVELKDVTAELARELNLKTPTGALLVSILGNSPASRSGLKVGEVVVGFNGQPVAKGADLVALIKASTAGTRAEVVVLRQGKRRVLSVTLGQMPAMQRDFRRGFDYANGKGVPKDYAKAIKWYRKAADQGHAQAQMNLGWLYKQGTGVGLDYTKAVYWFRKAADQGLAGGQFSLGQMYKTGQGVGLDYTQAAYWYRKAASQGFVIPQYELGVMYETGQGVTKDYTQAASWYRKAADQGMSGAQAGLGRLYYNGQGVGLDYTQAVSWYRKAANQGHVDAQAGLGWMYHKGKGVGLDYTQAVYWYRKAADQGQAKAQANLGWMYEAGHGVAKDKTQAVSWYRKAAAQGEKYAKDRLKKIKGPGGSAAGSQPAQLLIDFETPKACQGRAWHVYKVTIGSRTCKYDPAEGSRITSRKKFPNKRFCAALKSGSTRVGVHLSFFGGSSPLGPDLTRFSCNTAANVTLAPGSNRIRVQGNAKCKGFLALKSGTCEVEILRK